MRIASVEQRFEELRKSVLGLSGDREVESGLFEHKRIVRPHFRPADQHPGPRRAPLHFARQVQAAFAVPEIERETDEVGLVARDVIGQQRVAETVGHLRLDDLDPQAAIQTMHARGDGEAARRERDVAGRSQRCRRRHRQLHHAQLLHRATL